jgi:dTDP-4-dehydrorhamnose 3,5-epimerase
MGKLNVLETALSGVLILEPQVFGDARGWFTESWSEESMRDAGRHYRFMQDNHSYSAQNHTLRGIHFQKGEHAQAKLLRCSRGAVLDVAVDLRAGSPTYRRWISAELSADNKRQLLIPRGFGHAFLTLTDDVEFLYKADNPYRAEADRSIRWNDPAIGVDWGVPFGAGEPILSAKDAAAPLLADSDADFVYARDTNPFKVC